jgi:hypothetical protein
VRQIIADLADASGYDCDASSRTKESGNELPHSKEECAVLRPVPRVPDILSMPIVPRADALYWLTQIMEARLKAGPRSCRLKAGLPTEIAA